MAEEQGAFDFGGVVEAITQKMIRRHPHVFGDAKDLPAHEPSRRAGREIKAQEKAANGGSAARRRSAGNGLLDDIPLALPGLTRAVKLQKKASTVGFDWNDMRVVLDKIREETDEIEAALDSGDADAIEDEIGDLLFAVANLARHVGVDPEAAARRANAKFERRFRFIEEELAQRGVAPGEASLAEMDALWNEAKSDEKSREG